MSPPQQEPDEGKGSQGLILTQPSVPLQGLSGRMQRCLTQGLSFLGDRLWVFSAKQSLFGAVVWILNVI